MAPLLGSGLPKQSPERVEWCPETESNRHVLLGTRDFKSRSSQNSRACFLVFTAACVISARQFFPVLPRCSPPNSHDSAMMCGIGAVSIGRFLMGILERRGEL